MRRRLRNKFCVCARFAVLSKRIIIESNSERTGVYFIEFAPFLGGGLFVLEVSSKI